MSQIIRPVDLALLPPKLKEEVLRSRSWIGRNSPCVCGSGKRFKRCCAKGIRLTGVKTVEK